MLHTLVYNPDQSDAMLDYSDDYRGDRVIILTAILIPIQISSVILRQIARRIISATWGFENVLIYLSLVTQIAFAGLAFGMLPIFPPGIESKELTSSYALSWMLGWVIMLGICKGHLPTSSGHGTS